LVEDHHIFDQIHLRFHRASVVLSVASCNSRLAMGRVQATCTHRHCYFPVLVTGLVGRGDVVVVQVLVVFEVVDLLVIVFVIVFSVFFFACEACFVLVARGLAFGCFRL